MLFPSRASFLIVLSISLHVFTLAAFSNTSHEGKISSQTVQLGAIPSNVRQSIGCVLNAII